MSKIRESDEARIDRLMARLAERIVGGRATDTDIKLLIMLQNRRTDLLSPGAGVARPFQRKAAPARPSAPRKFFQPALG